MCRVEPSKGKIKEQHKSNERHETGSKPGEQLFPHIMSRKLPDKTALNDQNWRMMVNEYSRCHSANFYSIKNRKTEPTCSQFKHWRVAGKK